MSAPDSSDVPGSWSSPLSAASVTTASTGFRAVAHGPGGEVWWAEQRPREGGRTVLLSRSGEDPPRERVPAGFDARTSFHEYGGLCWTPLADGTVVSSSMSDQRLWLLGDDEPRPLTPDSGGASRYCLPQEVRGGLLCLREVLTPGQTRTARNELVLVPREGGEPVVLWDGSDFVDAPRVSPDGTQVAFLTWDHPRMPWDGTELRVAPFDGQRLWPVEVLLGGPAESVLQPEWDERGLRAVTDASGWWNLVRLPDGAPLWAVDEECGFPPWTPGHRSHATLPGGDVAVLHGRSTSTLSVLMRDGSVRPVPTPYASWLPALSTYGTRVLGLAGGPHRPWAVVEVDTADGAVRVVAASPAPDPAWVPVPERVQVTSTGGRPTYAHLYLPTSPEHRLEGPAPYVLMVHGGPTAHSLVGYDAHKAFWTSRGFGVADVDHGGSTGQGRAYRELLRGQWGVVDVDDCEAVARELLDSGRAGAVVIRGGSAGGWTVLSALTRGGSVFAAGASYFGVADLRAMAASTHDFESRYLDALVPPQEQAARSPLAAVDRLDRPLLVLQGLEDRVVTPEQAELLLAALAEREVPHAYLAFEGEGHGFRRAASQVAALEAELAFYGQVLGFPTPGVAPVPLRSA